MSEQSTVKFLLSKEGRGILIGTIVLLVVVIIIGIFAYGALFGGREPQGQQPPSAVENAPPPGNTNIKASRESVKGTTTSKNLNPEARAILDDYNDQADDLGLMPVPTPDNVEMVQVEPEQTAAPKPADTNEAKPQQPAPQPQTRRLTKEELKAIEEMRDARKEALQSYRSARLAEARAIMGVYAEPPTDASIAYASASEGDGTEPTGTNPGVKLNNDGTGSFFEGTEAGQERDSQCKSPLVKAGDIRYAQTDIALNTDFQGPVRMTFLEGNLAKWRGMGSFELNELGARMKLIINRLIDPDGQTYDVTGYVLDPDTTLWAMSSDVDYHVIYRYGGFGLGVVLGAFSDLADQRETDVENVTPDGGSVTKYREPDGKQLTWRLLGEFSRLFQEVFADNINRPITVKLAPNEEAGVLFEETVCEKDTDITKARKQAEIKAAEGLTDPVLIEEPAF
ncbi:MAG: hypothetical protein AWU57_531 [Marinobacter sp. T13-3]|nr:MAG: hypothetical protein AWU57_531 [Marinobacter sp. T13-3]